MNKSGITVQCKKYSARDKWVHWESTEEEQPTQQGERELGEVLER